MRRMRKGRNAKHAPLILLPNGNSLRASIIERITVYPANEHHAPLIGIYTTGKPSAHIIEAKGGYLQALKCASDLTFEVNGRKSHRVSLCENKIVEIELYMCCGRGPGKTRRG